MEASRPRTRRESGSKLSAFIGTAKEFLPSDVPTNRVVIQRMLLLREEKLTQGVNIRSYSLKEMIKDVVPLVLRQWMKSNISVVPHVTIGDRAIENKVKTLWEKVTSAAEGRGKADQRKRVEEDLDRLFDIVQCKHQIFTCQQGGLNPPCVPANCPKKVHINCTCSKEKKVPVTELEWLLSQRTKTGEKGGMQMATVDIPATKKHDKAQENKAVRARADLKRKRNAEEKQEELMRRNLEEEEEDETNWELHEDVYVHDYLPPKTKLTKEQERESMRLVKKLLVNWLGEDQVGLVTRYLDEPGVRKNYMAINHAARESLG